MSTKKLLAFAAASIVVVVAVMIVQRSSMRRDAVAGADAALPSEDAGPVTTPYLPARSAADDSYAPPSEVEAAIFSIRPGLNFCYRVASQTHPNLVANAVFGVDIDPNGHVTEVKLVSSDAKLDDNLVECIKGALVQAAFKPPPGGVSTGVNVPISFRPPRNGTPDGGLFGFRPSPGAGAVADAGH